LFLLYSFRSLMRRRQRTLAMIVGVALAVSLPVGLNASLDCAVEVAFEGVTKSVADDVRVILYPPLPEEQIGQQMDVFSAGQPVTYILRYRGDSVAVWLNTSDPHYRPSDLLAIHVGEDWFPHVLEVESGSLEAVKGNCCIISHELAFELHATVGTWIHVWVYGMRLDLEVAGVFRIPGFEGEPLIIVELDWLHQACNTTEVNEVGVRLEAEPWGVDAYVSGVSILVEAFKREFEDQVVIPDKVMLLEQREGQIEAHRLTMTMAALVSLLASAFGVSCFILLNYHEQLWETSLLKAMGASRGQLAAPLIFSALLVTLLGSLAAVPIGLLMSQAMLQLALSPSAPFFYKLDLQGAWSPRLRVTLGSVVIPVLFEFLLALAASAYPAVRAARTPPVTGLHPRSRRGKERRPLLASLFGAILSACSLTLLSLYHALPAVETSIPYLAIFALGVAGFLLAFLALVGPLSVIAFIFAPRLHGLERLVARNIARNRGSVWLTSCPFALAVLMILIFSGFAAAGQNAAVAEAYLSNGSDILVNGHHPPSMDQTVMQLEGVERAASILCFDTAQTSVDGRSSLPGYGEILSWFISPLNYSLTVHFEWMGLAGERLMRVFSSFVATPNCCLVSEPLAGYLGVGEGDEVLVKITATADGVLFERACLVIAVVDTIPGLGAYQNPFIILSVDDLEETAGLFGERLLVRLAGGWEAEEVASMIIDQNPQLVLDVDVTQVSVRNRLEQYSTTLTFYNYLSAFVLVVSGVGLAVALMASVRERRFELGILQSLGATRIPELLVAEAVTVGLMGVVAGAGMDALLTLALLIDSMLAGTSPVLLFPWQALPLALLAVCLVSLAGGMLAARYTRSETPASNLRRTS